MKSMAAENARRVDVLSREALDLAASKEVFPKRVLELEQTLSNAELCK
jgi:hypothetical protein